MRVFTNRSRTSLREAFRDLLLYTLSCERSEVWVISPWIRDVEFEVHGHFAASFGGHRSQVRLSEVLGQIAERHQLHVVTKPPEELVHFYDVLDLRRLNRARKDALRREELLAFSEFAELLGAIQASMAQRERSIVRHAETIRMGLDLARLGAHVGYVPRLHSKILWMPSGVLLGSANVTYSGFNTNEEVMVRITDAKGKAQIFGAIEELRSRIVGVHQYNLTPTLRELHLPEDLFRTTEEVKSSEVHHLLQDLDGMVRLE